MQKLITRRDAVELLSVSLKRFSIVPKDGQWENAFLWDHRARIVTLPETNEE